MKKGFTLIEILAVVTIIGLIFILVIPKITTSLKNKKRDVDITTNNLIITAAKNYVNDNHDKFDKIDNNTYCLPLTTLTKKDYLDSPVKNVTDDKDITNIKSVKITYNKGFKYEVVDKKECEVVYNPPCKSDYCDSAGNGYTEVEYLESTGTQWIDSGIKSSSDVKIDIEFMPTEYDDNPILGGRNSQRENQLLLNVWDNDVTYKSFVRFGNNDIISFGNLLLNTKYNVNFSKNGIYVDNVKVTDIPNNSFSDDGYAISIFGFRDITTGNMLSYGRLKLYTLKIYNDKKIERDYIPVLDDNNIPCLFDKIEKKCYYNQGSGEFFYKNGIENYEQIDYIESTGTQWIDTGIRSSNNIEINIDFIPTEYNDNPIVGGRNSNGENQILLNVWDNNGTYKSFVRFGINQIINIGNLLLNERYNVIFSKDGVYVNNKKVTNKFTHTFSDTGYGLSIFGFRNLTTGGMISYGRLKIYGVKIYNNKKLERYYIPVLDSSDRPCLYDKLEKKCYYNQGTGEFLYG